MTSFTLHVIIMPIEKKRGIKIMGLEVITEDFKDVRFHLITLRFQMTDCEIKFGGKRKSENEKACYSLVTKIDKLLKRGEELYDLYEEAGEDLFKILTMKEVPGGEPHTFLIYRGEFLRYCVSTRRRKLAISLLTIILDTLTTQIQQAEDYLASLAAQPEAQEAVTVQEAVILPAVLPAVQPAVQPVVLEIACGTASVESISLVIQSKVIITEPVNRPVERMSRYWKRITCRGMDYKIPRLRQSAYYDS